MVQYKSAFERTGRSSKWLCAPILFFFVFAGLDRTKMGREKRESQSKEKKKKKKREKEKKKRWKKGGCLLKKVPTCCREHTLLIEEKMAVGNARLARCASRGFP